MKLNKTLVAASFVVSLVACAEKSFGLAALANGAKTSCKPTSTNPAQHQIQLAADPMGITDFQFTMHYDTRLLSIATNGQGLPLVTGLNGYVLGVRGASTIPTFLVNPDLGLISVSGYWPEGPVPTVEINVFAVTFVLDGGIDGPSSPPLDTILNFDVLGLDPSHSLYSTPDYMNGVVLDDAGNVIGQQVYRNDGNANGDLPIFPSSSGPVAIVPEPASMAAILPAGLLLARRVRR